MTFAEPAMINLPEVTVCTLHARGSSTEMTSLTTSGAFTLEQTQTFEGSSLSAQNHGDLRSLDHRLNAG